MRKTLEDWVRIRVVLDVASIELTRASRGEKTVTDAIDTISNIASELLGVETGRTIRAFLLQELPASDVGSVLNKLQKLLVEGRSNED